MAAKIADEEHLRALQVAGLQAELNIEREFVSFAERAKAVRGSREKIDAEVRAFEDILKRTSIVAFPSRRDMTVAPISDGYSTEDPSDENEVPAEVLRFRQANDELNEVWRGRIGKDAGIIRQQRAWLGTRNRSCRVTESQINSDELSVDEAVCLEEFTKDRIADLNLRAEGE